MRLLLERFERFWCMHMHAEIMWPNKGWYQCRSCLRHYPVKFAAAGKSQAATVA